MAFEDDVFNNQGNYTSKYQTEDANYPYQLASEEVREIKSDYTNELAVLSDLKQLLTYKLSILEEQGKPSPDQKKLEKLRKSYDGKITALDNHKRSADKHFTELLTRYNKSEIEKNLERFSKKLEDATAEVTEAQKELERREKRLSELAGDPREQNLEKAVQELNSVTQDLENTNIRKNELEKKTSQQEASGDTAELEKTRTELDAATAKLTEYQRKYDELTSTDLIKAWNARNRQETDLKTIKSRQSYQQYELDREKTRQQRAERRLPEVQAAQKAAEEPYAAFTELLKKDDPQSLRDGLEKIEKQIKTVTASRDDAIAEDDLLKAQHNTALKMVRKNIQEVIDGTAAERATSAMTAAQLTNQIRQIVPTYHLDLSEQGQAKRTALHELAKDSLYNSIRSTYDDSDPAIAEGRKVWPGGRSQIALYLYVDTFMGREAKTELHELAKMADEGKSKTQEFINRRNELHRNICRDITAKADDKLKQYREMSTEEQLQNYKEISRFCNAGDITNAVAKTGLSPKEFQDYYRKLNPALNLLGAISHKIELLAGDFGDKLDVDQLDGLSKEQLLEIRGGADNPSVIEKSVNGNEGKSGPTELLEQIGDNRFTDLLNQLAESPDYPQFHRVYVTEHSGTSTFAEGYKENLVFQSPDGTELNYEAARTEVLQNKRPILVSTTNAPDAEPVMLYADKGVALFGRDAANKFRDDVENAPEIEPLAPQHTVKLGPLDALWNWICSVIEMLPFANTLDSVRTQKMIDYNAEEKVFKAQKEKFDRNLPKYQQDMEKSRELCSSEALRNAEMQEKKVPGEKPLPEAAKVEPETVNEGPAKENVKSDPAAAQEQKMSLLRTAVQEMKAALPGKFEDCIEVSGGAVPELMCRHYAAEAVVYRQIEDALQNTASSAIPEEVAGLLPAENEDRDLQMQLIRENIERRCEKLREGAAMKTVGPTRDEVENMLLNGTPEQQAALRERFESRLDFAEQLSRTGLDQTKQKQLSVLYSEVQTKKDLLPDKLEDCIRQNAELPESVRGQMADLAYRQLAAEATQYYLIENRLKQETAELGSSKGNQLSAGLAGMLPAEKEDRRVQLMQVQDHLQQQVNAMRDDPATKRAQPTQEQVRQMISAATPGQQRKAIDQFIKSVNAERQNAAPQAGGNLQQNLSHGMEETNKTAVNTQGAGQIVGGN